MKFVNPSSTIDTSRVKAALGAFYNFVQQGYEDRKNFSEDGTFKHDIGTLAKVWMYNALHQAAKPGSNFSVDSCDNGWDFTNSWMSADSVEDLGEGADVVSLFAHNFSEIIKMPTPRVPLLDEGIIRHGSIPGGLGADSFNSWMQYNFGKASPYGGKALNTNDGGTIVHKFSQSVIPVVYTDDTTTFITARMSAWKIDEISNMMKNGTDSVRNTVHDMLLNGDDSLNVYGMLNHPLMTRTYRSVNWDSSVSDTDDIITDMLDARIANYSASLDTYDTPGKLIIPTRTARFLQTTFAGDTNKDHTLLSKLSQLSELPDIKGEINKLVIGQMAGLQGAVQSLNVGLFFNQTALQAILPTDVMMLPVERTGFTVRVILVQMVGGIRIEDFLGAHMALFEGDY
jgi:hypothetical protein